MSLNLFFPVLLLFCSFIHSAYAYLDPGTGSYILQLLIGGIFGAMVAFKLYWGKIKTWFTNLKNSTQKKP